MAITQYGINPSTHFGNRPSGQIMPNDSSVSPLTFGMGRAGILSNGINPDTNFGKGYDFKLGLTPTETGIGSEAEASMPLRADTKSTFGTQPKQEYSEESSGIGILGGITTGALTAGLPGAIIGGVVGITSAVANWYAMKKQNEEIDRVNNIQLSVAREERADKRRAEQWLQEYENKKMENEKKINEYTKIQNFMNNFQSLLSSKPALQANLINAWKSRSK